MTFGRLDNNIVSNDSQVDKDQTDAGHSTARIIFPFQRIYQTVKIYKRMMCVAIETFDPTTTMRKKKLEK